MRGEDERLRPVDLARLAGASTQQIRNYVDLGVLPPAERTSSGYRVLHGGHRRALTTYLALVEGFGTQTARSILMAVHAGDVTRALAIVDESHAELHERRLSLQAAGEALEAVAAQDVPSPSRSPLRIGEVAAHLGVRTSALRVWEAEGLLKPKRERVTGYRAFGPSDVRDARMINMLRQGRYPLAQIRPLIDGLRETGGSAALRTAVADRRAALTGQARAMLKGAAHLHTYLSEDIDGS
ncbi:MerR family transcriptional regulator [Spirillospora sp. CA-294931]|uniref:MerR family transcriptional regulator n=1 Tax=Spirillospora sp. CA-294931 TaxID=3240042 RepID=UPI003D8EE579